MVGDGPSSRDRPWAPPQPARGHGRKSREEGTPHRCPPRVSVAPAPHPVTSSSFRGAVTGPGDLPAARTAAAEAQGTRGCWAGAGMARISALGQRWQRRVHQDAGGHQGRSPQHGTATAPQFPPQERSVASRHRLPPRQNPGTATPRRKRHEPQPAQLRQPGHLREARTRADDPAPLANGPTGSQARLLATAACVILLQRGELGIKRAAQLLEQGCGTLLHGALGAHAGCRTWGSPVCGFLEPRGGSGQAIPRPVPRPSVACLPVRRSLPRLPGRRGRASRHTAVTGSRVSGVACPALSGHKCSRTWDVARTRTPGSPL